MEDNIILDVFGDEMESLALDMEELEESKEPLQEETNEIDYDNVSLREFVMMALNSSESDEVYTEVVVNNFDSFDTPLNSCTAFTITCLLLFFFLALATVGGVLNE